MLIPLQHNTFRFFISLILWVSLAEGIHSQNTNNKVNVDSNYIRSPFLKGIRVELDVSPLVSTFILGTEHYQWQAATQFHLRNQYLPIVEVGVSGSNIHTPSGIHYRTDGLFYRVGLDISAIRPANDRQPTNHLLLVGARLGYSGFTYELNNIVINDPYWNRSEIRNGMQHTTSRFWMEIVAGLRVEIFTRAYLGWSIRYKSLFGYDVPGAYKPLFIPGYGMNNENNWAFSYLIGYKF